MLKQGINTEVYTEKYGDIYLVLLGHNQYCLNSIDKDLHVTDAPLYSKVPHCSFKEENWKALHSQVISFDSQTS